MSALLVGYAHAPLALGVEPDHVNVDHGLTGTNRERPGLREALGGVPRETRSGHQARPARPFLAGCSGDRGRADHEGNQPQPRRLGL